MSTAKDRNSTGRPPMKRRPSTTEATPARPTEPTGGSRSAAYSPTVKSAASTASAAE